MKVTMIPTVIGALVSPQRIVTRTGGHGINGTDGDNPNNCITENGQNTDKSPGDLRRLAVTQTPVEKPSVITVKNSQDMAKKRKL